MAAAADGMTAAVVATCFQQLMEVQLHNSSKRPAVMSSKHTSLLPTHAVAATHQQQDDPLP